MGLFVDGAGAAALLGRGATVLDSRGLVDFAMGHLPGAVRLGWRVGVEPGLTNGLLGDPQAAAAAFAAAGVDEERPVLVVGAWAGGWGEEGRLAWDLCYLGHPSVHILRGGAAAWVGPWAYLPGSPSPGRFRARVVPGLRAGRAELAQPGVTILDVREPDEFAGATRYGERRGGHIPGAVNRPWKGLLAGVDPLPGRVITTCTGGVRSAMAWALLHAAGVDVCHHDGGWWAYTGDEP